MLNKVDPELNLLKRAWKAIKNFISKWVWRTDTSIDNILIESLLVIIIDLNKIQML